MMIELETPFLGSWKTNYMKTLKTQTLIERNSIHIEMSPNPIPTPTRLPVPASFTSWKSIIIQALNIGSRDRCNCFNNA